MIFWTWKTVTFWTWSILQNWENHYIWVRQGFPSASTKCFCVALLKSGWTESVRTITTSSSGENHPTALDETSLTENTPWGSRKCCHHMRKHHVTLPALLSLCSLGIYHLVTAMFPISNICCVSNCLRWQWSGLPSIARNWNGMCVQLSQSHLAGVSMAREYIPGGYFPLPPAGGEMCSVLFPRRGHRGSLCFIFISFKSFHSKCGQQQCTRAMQQ